MDVVFLGIVSILAMFIAVADFLRLVAFSFMQPSLLKYPPMEPLPHPTTDSDFFGEIWLHYPANINRNPSHFGDVFFARAQFRIIMNDFCNLAYHREKRLGIPLEDAYRFHSRLEAWYDGLPPNLTPRQIVLPFHLQLQ